MSALKNAQNGTRSQFSISPEKAMAGKEEPPIVKEGNPLALKYNAYLTQKITD
jgi:hypothetical protein